MESLLTVWYVRGWRWLILEVLSFCFIMGSLGVGLVFLRSKVTLYRQRVHLFPVLSFLIDKLLMLGV